MANNVSASNINIEGYLVIEDRAYIEIEKLRDISEDTVELVSLDVENFNDKYYVSIREFRIKQEYEVQYNKGLISLEYEGMSASEITKRVITRYEELLQLKGDIDNLLKDTSYKEYIEAINKINTFSNVYDIRDYNWETYSELLECKELEEFNHNLFDVLHEAVVVLENKSHDKEYSKDKLDEYILKLKDYVSKHLDKSKNSFR